MIVASQRPPVSRKINLVCLDSPKKKFSVTGLSLSLCALSIVHRHALCVFPPKSPNHWHEGVTKTLLRLS